MTLVERLKQLCSQCLKRLEEKACPSLEELAEYSRLSKMLEDIQNNRDDS